MKVVDIERVVILMRFIQFGWSEERKKAFDEDLRAMLETQCEDLEEYGNQIIDQFATALLSHDVVDKSVVRRVAEQMKGQDE